MCEAQKENFALGGVYQASSLTLWSFSNFGPNWNCGLLASLTQSHTYSQCFSCFYVKEIYIYIYNPKHVISWQYIQVTKFVSDICVCVCVRVLVDTKKTDKIATVVVGRTGQ